MGPFVVPLSAWSSCRGARQGMEAHYGGVGFESRTMPHVRHNTLHRSTDNSKEADWDFHSETARGSLDGTSGFAGKRHVVGLRGKNGQAVWNPSSSSVAGQSGLVFGGSTMFGNNAEPLDRRNDSLRVVKTRPYLRLGGHSVYYKVYPYQESLCHLLTRLLFSPNCARPSRK